MFDGKIFRGETGMPMRKIERAKSSLAEAEPEPFTLANLTTKSLTAWMPFILSMFASRRLSLRIAAAGPGICHLEQELLHIPCTRRAALRAKPAMQTHVFVFCHDPPGLERLGDVKRLVGVQRRRSQTRAQ